MKYEVYYEKGNGYCYKNEQGKIVSETYKYANPFDEYGIALIEDFNKDYYFINEKFEKISPPYYFASEFFTVGNKRMAAINRNSGEEWYFIDQNFEIISPACRSLMGTLYDSEDYNGGKLPFMTLRDFNYFLDLNFQKVSPKYFHVETPFYYFPTLDENCAEVEERVDGKYLHYLINEDFVKITHGVEERPLNWAGYIEHIIPEKVKSNKTYSRILSGEPITQVSKTDEVQLEKTLPPAQSIVEMVKNGTLHSDNSTSTEENKTTSNSTSTIVTQSENIAPKEDEQPKKPATPQEKKSVVEMVKEGSIHSDNGNGTTDNTSSTTETQSLSPEETPRKETKKSVVETVKTRSNRSKDSVAEEKSPPSDCKYKKVKEGSKWVFKDENGKKVSKEYDIIGDFDDHGITNVGNFPRRHGIDNPCFYYKIQILKGLVEHMIRQVNFIEWAILIWQLPKTFLTSL
ncbi:MAG: hypothetical protein E7345_05445 [Clostridiales bacterium]|nr:hypothetical protein [Clostridiales bacterium]